jgi:uncharacterized protein (TIGR03067 family)
MRGTLAASTLRGAMSFVAGNAAGTVPASVTALAEGVLRAMFNSRMTRVALLLLFAFVAAGVGLASLGKASGPGTSGGPQARTAGPLDEKAKATEPRQKLQGTWISKDGWGIISVIGGETITVHSRPEQQGQQAKLRIDPAKRPRELDISYPGAVPVPAIYQVEGDTLKVCLGESGKPRPGELKGPSLVVFRKLPVRKGVVTAIAADLWTTYQDNEALADEELTDRQVAVVGSVLRIRRGGNGYALLVEADKDLPLLFRFGQESRKQLAKLKPGQLVTVEGKCLGRARAAETGKEAIVFSAGKIVTVH